jgi:ferric-dicitrate binding protein FerR (iron transport regulator)
MAIDIKKPQWAQHITDAAKWHFKLYRTEHSRRSMVGFTRWIKADPEHLRAYRVVALAVGKAAKRVAAKLRKRGQMPSRKP